MKTLVIISLVLASQVGAACALEKRSGGGAAGASTTSTATGSTGGATVARNIGASSSAFSRETTGDPFGSVGTREGRAAEGESRRRPGASRRGSIQ